MSHASRIAATALLLLGASRIATADVPDIVIESPGERSTNTKIILGALVGAGAIAGGLGVFWHLDSRSASDELSAGKFTGEAWTTEDIALSDQAERSKTRATLAYGVGGALLIGAVIAFIVSDPPSETVVITPRRASATIVPTQGGAVVGGTWSF